jgi:hypothetical protein
LAAPKIVVGVIHPPTFTLAEEAAALEYLDQQGYVVFRDVITTDLQDRYISEVRDWIVR